MSAKGEPRANPRSGFLSLEGVDPARIHRGWQLTNTLWALVQRVVALLLLVLSVPLLLALYLPVRISSRAPFFFRQKRPGFMGREFRIVKITTMRKGSDKVSAYEKGVAIDDPNVTRIGRFLRDTKLDELPQLWNVVKARWSSSARDRSRPASTACCARRSRASTSATSSSRA
jgi:hypothetical protein